MFTKYTSRTFAREVVVVVAAFLMMSPFLILLNTSLKSDEEVLTTTGLQPSSAPGLGAFRVAWAGTASETIPTGMFNSFVITVGSVVVLILCGALAAFTLSRRPGKVSNALYVLFLIGIIFPVQLGIIPTYVALRHLGLLGSYLGMILLYSGLLMPLSVFLYTGFTRLLPRDYEEAALIDGASPFQAFRHVVFPLLGPATGTVAILTGLIIWNDFFTALIFLGGTERATLPVVVYGFVGSLVSRWNVVFSAVILSMIPILAFYLIAQKRFIQGFAGGVKS